jgi:hypothetical protein
MHTAIYPQLTPSLVTITLHVPANPHYFFFITFPNFAHVGRDKRKKKRNWLFADLI